MTGDPQTAAVPGPASGLVAALRERGLTLGVGESLTGGLLAAEVVAVPGASDVLVGGVVAYAPRLKSSLLGVDDALLAEVGTVHPEVARQMAEGVRRALGCDVALATTGVAGPGPAEGHPAGTVHLACVTPFATELRALQLSGGRPEVRAAAVAAAVALAGEVLAREPHPRG